MDHEAIGERIRRARLRRSYGQADLAREAGLAKATLWLIEHGRQQPRPATVRKIAAVLGIDVEELTSPEAR